MTGAPTELLAECEALLAECEAHGIRLLPDGEGGLAIDTPRDALTPDLLARLKAHKADVLALLRPAPEPGDVTPCVNDPAIRCPWCGGMRLDEDDQRGGLRCAACVRLAFQDTPSGGLVRCDQAHGDDVDPKERNSCPTCGALELWQTLVGNWRCLHCDPPTTSRQLAEFAARTQR